MPSSRTAIVLAAGALALVALVWIVGARRRPAPSALTAERAAAEPETALALAAPSIADPTVAATTDPSDAPSTRTAAEPAPLALTFRILEKGTDAPIAGARLRTYEDSAPGTWTTDERGECTVTLPAGAHDFRLHVEADGFVHLELEKWDDESSVLHLRRATTLTGRLLAADTGEPLPGASIALGSDHCDAATAVADFAGRYVLTGVPLRDPETTVLLKAPGFPDQRRWFELRSDEPRIEQDFLLQRGIEIHGHVVDWSSGVGVMGATVAGIATDAAGAFRGRMLSDPTASTVVLRVAAYGYCDLVAPIDSDRIGDDHLLRIPRGAVVEGVVRDGSGEPVAGAMLRVEPDRRELGRPRTQDVAAEPRAGELLPEGWSLFPGSYKRGFASVDETDAEGRYRIANVVPWRPNSLRVNAKGFRDARRAIEPVCGPNEVTQIDLVLEPDVTVAVPEASLLGTLRLNGADFSTARGRVRWKGSTRSGEERIFNGGFAMRVEPGALTLDVEVDGLPAGLEGAHVELASVPESTFVDLRIPTRSITGRVTYTDGTPARGVEVTASCELHQVYDAEYAYWEQLPVSANAGLDGGFVLDVPDLDRPYDVVAKVPNDRARVADVRAGASGVHLVLQVPGRLLFRALDAVSRAPITGHDLELGWKRPDEERFHYWSVFEHAPDPDGWIEQQFPAGRLDLCARTRRSDHVPLFFEDVLVPASGEPARVEFALARGIRVQLVLAEGMEPPPPVDIVLVEEALFDQVRFNPIANSVAGGALGGAVQQRLVRFDGQRTCEPGALGPGRYRFKVEPPDIVIEPEFVTLQEGVPQTIEVRWRPAR